MRFPKVLAPITAALIFSIAASSSISNAFAGQTTRVSVTSAGLPASAGATNGVLSADGRYVVFQSSSSNLAGARRDTYRQTARRALTELVTVDGRYSANA